MSNPTAVQDVEWEPLVPGTLDASGTGSAKKDAACQETSHNAFQFLYGAPEDGNLNIEFIPLYGQSDAEFGENNRQAESAENDKDAQEDPEAVLKRSYEERFSKGEKEGFEAGMQKADPIVERMQSILTDIEGLWEQLVQTYEEKIIQLVSRVSEKVILGQVAVDHDTVKRVILDAFRMIPEPVEATIDIHPEDAEHIENIKEEFFQQLKTLKQISLQQDASISPGGCRVKTRLGEVDATLESRLEVIQQTIMNVYKSKGSHNSDA